MAKGRPATPLGSWGEIHVDETKVDENGKTTQVKVSTYLRLFNGKTVRVRATAKSKTAATNKLKERCRQRLGSQDTTKLSSTSTVNALFDTWIAQHDVKDQTKDRYRNSFSCHIKPALGEVRINEVDTATLHEFVRSISQGTAGNVHSVLKGMFDLAARFGLVPVSPMTAVKKPKSKPKEVLALVGDQAKEFIRHIRKSNDQTLIDVCIMSISTGLRAGEVLGVRWEDVDLDANPPLVFNTGTLVYSKAGGHKRQDEGKSENSTRPVEVPKLAREILERRKEQYGEHLEMVFPSENGTYIWENNFNKKLRKHRGKEWGWVTIHVMRKTLSTMISDFEKRNADLSAIVLGHSDSRLTQRTYTAHGQEVLRTAQFVDEFLKGA